MPSSRTGHDLTPPSPADLARRLATLDPEQVRVTQRAGTEPPFCGVFHDHHADGTYRCVVCELPLFASDAKFDSGTGWPSFFQPVDPDHVRSLRDDSHGMRRTEIRCARCGAHLGHVFPDGPPPTRARYCLNSVALAFTPASVAEAFFAGGCFWGVEDAFARLSGVLDAASGYAGGHVPSPTYEQVCTGDTGHAETVRVRYDPSRVSYRDLVRTFFRIHDPTTRDRQGPDVGSQYRSAVFTGSDEEARIVREEAAAVEARGTWGRRPVVTEIAPATTFWRAEEHHQDWHARHGGVRCS